MKLLLLLSLIETTAHADLSQRDVDRMAVAIFRAEGGYSAKYLYGVKSVPHRTESEARRICENSVRNNYARWVESRLTNNFIPFMAKRYCPLDQTNWAKNVKYFYSKK